MSAFASSSRRGAAVAGLFLAVVSGAVDLPFASAPARAESGIEVVPGVKLKGPATTPFAASSEADAVAPAEAVDDEPAAGSKPALAPAAAPIAAPATKAVPAATVEAGAVYNQRAKKLLEAESNATAAEHPLAAAYPSHDVVVCTAGCQRDVADIVYLERRGAKSSVNVASPELASLPAEAVVNVVACVGGCYSEYPSAYGAGHADAPYLGHAAGSWMTTTTPVPSASATTGDAAPAASPERWYQRINPGTAGSGTP